MANSDFSDADEDVTVKVDDPSGSAMITVGSGFKHAGGGDDAKCAQMAKVLDRVVDPSYISEDGDLTIVLEASATVDAHPCTEAYYYLYATVTLYMAECLPCPQFAGSAANDHASCTCGLGYMGPSVGPCRLSFYLVDLAITVRVCIIPGSQTQSEAMRAVDRLCVCVSLRAICEFVINLYGRLRTSLYGRCDLCENSFTPTAAAGADDGARV